MVGILQVSPKILTLMMVGPALATTYPFASKAEQERCDDGADTNIKGMLDGKLFPLIVRKSSQELRDFR